MKIYKEMSTLQRAFKPEHLNTEAASLSCLLTSMVTVEDKI